MNFVDEATIFVQAGDGGDGSAAFRREAHVPLGGPAGGDGGRGGDVVIEASQTVRTLLDCRYQKRYRAGRGGHGSGQDRCGRTGESRVIPVPVGTMVFDAETNELLFDITEPGSRAVVAEGGRGGRGNQRFKTSTDRAPRKAEAGYPGQARSLRLELKLLADVGLVGAPNVGKSTFLSKISAAKPKVADYPFTTLTPNLGVVSLAGERTLTVADIPGLIEGAAEGVGLGHRFLRHVERASVLMILFCDSNDADCAACVASLAAVEHELEQFGGTIAQKKRIYVLNKADLLSKERINALQGILRQTGRHAITMSAVTGHGVDAALNAAWECVVQKEELG